MVDWRAKANDILAKIKGYQTCTDGWKVAKKAPEVTVWWKQSADWNGILYKAEGELYADAETVFSYVDPTPTSPRSQWDKAIKELQIVDKIDESVSVVRTITRSAFGGLISSRDFTDLVINVKTDDFYGTHAEGVAHPKCPASSDFIRGTNYPCAILCSRLAGEPTRTRVTCYIQTDLGGMLPKTLVDNALPANQVDFFSALKRALVDGGHGKGPADSS